MVLQKCFLLVHNLHNFTPGATRVNGF